MFTFTKETIAAIVIIGILVMGFIVTSNNKGGKGGSGSSNSSGGTDNTPQS